MPEIRQQQRRGGSYFQWRGRNRKGVSRWVGSADTPPVWAAYLLSGLGAGFFLAGMGSLLFGNGHLAIPFLGVTALYAVLIAWMVSIRSRILGLTPVEKAAVELGITEEELDQFAEEHGVKPVYEINGRNFYELAALRDEDHLLRASQPTVDNSTLLHAAASSGTDMEGNLLRPAEDTEPRVITAHIEQEQPLQQSNSTSGT